MSKGAEPKRRLIFTSLFHYFFTSAPLEITFMPSALPIPTVAFFRNLYPSSLLSRSFLPPTNRLQTLSFQPAADTFHHQ